MNAKEIRDLSPRRTGSPGAMYQPNVLTERDCHEFIGDMLRECAAQIAEANEHLERFNTEDNIGSIAVDVEKLTRPRWVWFKYNTFRYVVDAREVASISVPDQNHCVIIMRNEGGSDPGRWCEGGYEEVCSKLGIPTEEGK